METEFDRFLLELDGKLLPAPRDTTGHMRLTRQGAQAIAPLYPSVTPALLQCCVSRMRVFTRLFTGRQGLRHAVPNLTPSSAKIERKTERHL